METVLFLLDGVLVAALCFMTLKDDRRPRGAPAMSLFRYREDLRNRVAPPRKFVPGGYSPDAKLDLGGKPRR